MTWIDVKFVWPLICAMMMLEVCEKNFVWSALWLFKQMMIIHIKLSFPNNCVG